MSSKIEWTEDTWNPIIGCDKVSAGCKNCYAIQTAWIRQHNPKMLEKYAGTVEKNANGSLNWSGKINMHDESLVKPLKAKKPTTYFVNSMSDLFHDNIPFEFIKKVFAVMAVTPNHTYQILTKRPQRMLEFFNWCPPEVPEWVADDFYGEMEDFIHELCDTHEIETGCGSWIEIPLWPLPNVWIGVSVEDQKAADERIPLLLQVPAAVRFLSCEPLLGPVDLQAIGHGDQRGLNALTGEFRYYRENDGECCSEWGNFISWVICGGESGSGARPMHPDWARSLRDQCKDAEVAFFFKQWGEYWPGEYGRLYREKSIDFTDGQQMVKTGKKLAGRQLDGVEHNEYPVNPQKHSA